MKKTVSLILCLMILLSAVTMSFSVNAAEITEPAVMDEAGSGVHETDTSGEGIASTGISLDDPIIVPRVVVTTEDGNGTSLLKSNGYVNANITITDTDGSELTDDDGHMNVRAAVTDEKLSITDATAIQRYIASMGNPYELNIAVKTKLKEK